MDEAAVMPRRWRPGTREGECAAKVRFFEAAMMAAVLLPARTISRPRCAAATTTRAAARADAALARSSATLPLPSPDSARSSALSSSMKATSWSILAAALVVASASGRLLGRGACVRGGAEEDSMFPPPAPRSRTLFRSSLIHCSCWSPCPEEDMGKPRGRRQYKPHDGGKLGFLLFTVKRDTQKERTTKSRKSWGAKAVRVRATGSPRAHRCFAAVGHGRRSPRFRNLLIGALRGK